MPETKKAAVDNGQIDALGDIYRKHCQGEKPITINGIKWPFGAFVSHIPVLQRLCELRTRAAIGAAPTWLRRYRA